ncbi:MAG: UDP-galactopyranose mutase, partial [Candidatus Kapabacteria bacterium]|nr:UDP-galactopyranose mutase [Candidatus Kapabacteria bacterium]
VAQMNFPNTNDYTRVTEFKHLTAQKHHKTTIAFEYSELYDKEKNEPYYPIPQEKNNELYLKYKAEVDKLDGKVYFVGRLADYKYYNMDQTIGVALQLFEKKIANQ